MTNTTLIAAEPASTSPEMVVRDWLHRFEAALAHSDASAVMELFSAAPMWRDNFALTWDIVPTRGTGEVERFISEVVKIRTLSELEVYPALRIAADHDGVITAMFSFRTDLTTGVGVLRLVNENDRFVAWTVSTDLQDLVDHPRPVVSVADAAREEYNMLHEDSTVGTHRAADDYLDHDPEVLIVGGGQSGLILAARLVEDGIDTLVLDKYERAGDSWRQRYDSLRLHDTKWFAQLPYLPFPPQWPLFSTKNGMGDWLELFTIAMGINLWTRSPVVAATYDESAKRWEVTAHRDGERRTLRPSQVVFATGNNGLPNLPTVPGAEVFKGFIAHSSEYRGTDQFPGKKVLVVGTGCSGMDIAKDAYSAGSEVTLLQRGPCNVMSTRHGVPHLFGAYFSENSPPHEVSDSLATSWPSSYQLEELAPAGTRALAQLDKELLDGLEAAGFRTSQGPNDQGHLYFAFTKGGSYYIDNGGAELVISRKIAMAHGSVDRFTPTGVVLDDGTELEADAVVFATGFANMRESVRPIVGDEAASKIASVWGLDEKGELRTAFRHSGHERLWMFTGGVFQARVFSRPISVMIKAIERGVLSDVISVKLRASDVYRGEYRPAGSLSGQARHH